MKVTLTRRVHDAMHHEGNIVVKGFVLQQGVLLFLRRDGFRRGVSRKVNEDGYFDLSKMLSVSSKLSCLS